MLVPGPGRRRAQQDVPVQGDQLYSADLRAMYVVPSPLCYTGRLIPLLVDRYLRPGNDLWYQWL